MADRKQFLKPVALDPELAKLLQRAKQKVVSDKELREQRISFAYGNAPQSLQTTKKRIRHVSKRIRLAG